MTATSWLVTGKMYEDVGIEGEIMGKFFKQVNGKYEDYNENTVVYHNIAHKKQWYIPYTVRDYQETGDTEETLSCDRIPVDSCPDDAVLIPKPVWDEEWTNRPFVLYNTYLDAFLTMLKSGEMQWGDGIAYTTNFFNFVRKDSEYTNTEKYSDIRIIPVTGEWRKLVMNPGGSLGHTEYKGVLVYLELNHLDYWPLCELNIDLKGLGMHKIIIDTYDELRG